MRRIRPLDLPVILLTHPFPQNDTQPDPNDDARDPDSPDSVTPDETTDGESGATSDHRPDRPTEIGGQKGPEPTRYGDWEGGGRCTDF